MVEYPKIERLRVTSHVASNEESNVERAHAPGLRRANAIIAALVARGLEAATRGADEPLVPNDTPDRRAVNRNVQFVIIWQQSP